MGNIINTAMRGLQFLWALLVLALTANFVAEARGNSSIINYDLFCAIFAMLSLFYLIPASIKDSLQIHAMFPLILDILNTLFWFCGAVATAAKLGVHSCDNDAYLRRNGVTSQAGPRSKGCTEAQASCAFLFFGFACFAVSCVFSGLGMGGGGPRPSKIGRGPMSHV